MRKAILDSQRYYDELAEDFRDLDTFWDNPYDNEIWRLENLLAKRHLQENQPVLDLGCGFYPHDQLLCRGATLVAGDLSVKSLRVALCQHGHQPRLDAVALDAHSLPFADQQFSMVIAGGELLNHVNCAEVLREIQRVLRPRGVVLIEVGMKWCLDSLWAMIDSVLGQKIGYAMTRAQALQFFKPRTGDVLVSWEVTPSGVFTVTLLSYARLKRVIDSLGLTIVETRGTNLASGIVPLPLQQTGSRLVQKVASQFIKVDRLLGRIYPLNVLSGNLFIVLKTR